VKFVAKNPANLWNHGIKHSKLIFLYSYENTTEITSLHSIIISSVVQRWSFNSEEFATLKEFIISKTGLSTEIKISNFSKIDISNLRLHLKIWTFTMEIIDIEKTIQNKPSIKKTIFWTYLELSRKDSKCYVQKLIS